MKILFFGDIVGKIGRKAIVKILPKLKKEFKPDLVLANGENLAHGKGVTVKTIREVAQAGIDFFTSGNHFWSKKKQLKKVLEQKIPIIRPANYLGRRLGNGWKEFKVKKDKILIINLIGKVFIENKKNKLSNPFKKSDKILKENQNKIVIIDFHGEATAEKKAFAYYLDGRVSAILGTHTHVQTSDQQILPLGTAYITDVGMVGAKDSVIGFQKDASIKRNLTSQYSKSPKLEIPEKGKAIINGVFLDIDSKTGQAKSIKRIAEETLV